MSENLFLGDSTYPHLAASTKENICAQLRELAPDLVDHHTKQIVFAADRIEQLERELDQEKTDCTEALLAFAIAKSRYEYVRKLNVQQFQEIFLRNLAGFGHFDDLVDAAINGVKE